MGINREELIADIDGLQTTFDAFKMLKRLAAEVGYNKFTVMGLPQFGEELQDRIVVNNWNPELTQAYAEYGLTGDSPVLERLRNSVLPFTWEVEKVNAARPKGQREVAIDLFRTFEMNEGVYIPVRGVDGDVSAVGFSGVKSEITTEQLDALTIVAMAACERLAAITQEQAEIVLTERERECLQWTAAGKTSGEIGDILGLSEHTVNHYMGAVTGKLDAVTRSQAVAKALRLRLIA